MVGPHRRPRQTAQPPRAGAEQTGGGHGPARNQYLRMTPTTIPWISTSSAGKYIGSMVGLAG